MKMTVSYSLLYFTGAVFVGTTLWLGKRIFFDDPYDNIEAMNDLLSCYSSSPRTIDTTEIHWAIEFRNNWEKIKLEFENYQIENIVPRLEDVNYNNSLIVDKGKWRSLILRTFCIDTKATKYFPETMKLINNSNSSMTLAMFSLLEPGTKLPRHNGMYKGVLRYFQYGKYYLILLLLLYCK
jgi:aspartyl/asparaginyl beta-hydroxylase (cupin superfamily)